jgi:predicted MPP superfamily phosphohydrolase
MIMPLLDDMIKRLNARIAGALSPYPQFIFFSDVHYRTDTSNAGFEKVLSQISAQEKDSTLFILIGGDLVDKGSDANYTAFVNRCNRFFLDTGIPIIPTMGNHEFYGVSPNETEIQRYRKYIGNANFPVEISAQGLPASLTVVAFNDAKPRKPVKLKIQDRANNCKTITRDRHVFYFRDNYIHLDPLAPEKFSHFPEYLNQSRGEHIVVTSHVPPRKTPLPETLDALIQKEYAHCVSQNPVISMSKLKSYYRDLWMLVHGNSDYSYNLDSTQMLVNEIKNRQKVELVLTGHVHTYYTFPLAEANHPLQVVISGGGGNKSAQAITSSQPVTKYHYIQVKYDATLRRFYHIKVDAGN